MDLEALVSTLGRGDDRRVADQRVVDTRVRHEVGLELVQIDVESTVETQRRRDRAHDLGDQAVQVFVRRSGNIQVASANVIDSLVVNQECAVRVLNGAVGGQNGIVGLDHSGGNAWSRVNGELELGLLAVLSGQSLKKQCTKARTRTTTEGVEDQETLEGVAVV